MASFYPVAFVVREVGGDRVELTTLTPQGVEPHDLELSTGQVRGLLEADALFYLGGGFQPALEDVVPDLGDKATDVGRGQDVAEDPHVWLDPSAMERIVGIVADRLSAIDPAGKQRYADSARALERRLVAVDRSFERGLATCERRELVTNHEAFGHLAERYGLEQIGISGIDPDAEPSPARLAEVAEIARANDVEVIFFEELGSSEVAETLAGELGIRTDVLSPMESTPEEGDYFSAMRMNLERLREALSCE